MKASRRWWELDMTGKLITAPHDTMVNRELSRGSILLSVVARHYSQRFSLLIWIAVAYSPSQAALTDMGEPCRNISSCTKH